MAPKKPKVIGMTYGGHSFGSGSSGAPADSKVSVSMGSAPAEDSGVSPEAQREAQAVITVLEALQGLPPESVERVLTVVVEEYNSSR